MDASSELAVPQIRSVQGIITELEANGTPQILVLNKADAVGADPELAARAASTDWAGLDDNVTPCQVVATSARDGRGLDKLLAAIEAALLRMAIEVDCVLPYSEAALLAEVHKMGTITVEEYVEQGTHVVAHVPLSLRNRLEKACTLVGAPFASEEVKTGRPPRAELRPRARASPT